MELANLGLARDTDTGSVTQIGHRAVSAAYQTALPYQNGGSEVTTAPDK